MLFIHPLTVSLYFQCIYLQCEHANLLIIAAVVVDVVEISVPLQHLLQIVFKVFLEANGFIQLNLVTFKPLPSGYDN